MDLIGKWVLASEEASFSFLKIEGKIDDFYLVSNHTNNYPVTGLRMYNMHQMVTLCEHVFWEFFNTKEELDAYVEWLESPLEQDQPPKENVFKLVKKGE